MEHKEYNGWYNYETWLLALNVNNDHGLYDARREMVKEGTEKNMSVQEIADILKDWLEELSHIDEHGIYKLSDSWTYRDWSEINWDEIAEAWIADEKEIQDIEKKKLIGGTGLTPPGYLTGTRYKESFPHTKLTGKEMERMRDLLASGPLEWREDVDTMLRDRGLLSDYDIPGEKMWTSVNPNYGVLGENAPQPFYLDNGTINPYWYDFGIGGTPKKFSSYVRSGIVSTAIGLIQKATRSEDVFKVKNELRQQFSEGKLTLDEWNEIDKAVGVRLDEMRRRK